MRIILGGILFVLSVLAHAEDVRLRFKRRTSVEVVSAFDLSYSLDGDQYKSLNPVPRTAKFQITHNNQQWEIKNGESVIALTAPVLHLQSAQILLSGYKKLPEKVELHGKGQSYDIVARVEVEQYLKGVLPSEMPASWPLEALRAQAVAARSYTLHLLEERKHLHFDLDTTIQDQVYSAQIYQSLSKSNKRKIAKAISTTDKITLQFRDKVLKAYYHAHCGGKTELPHNVWGQGKGFSTVEDKSCQGRSRWQYSITKKDLLNKLGSKSDKSVKGVQISVLSKTVSHRNHEIIVGPDEQNIKLTAQELRKAVGYKNLKSTNFNYRSDKEKFYFEGVGSGHGVGLCQWGARDMALKGFTYAQILRHYYPKAHTKISY